MIDLRFFLDPEKMNEPVSPWARWPLGVILAAGFLLCVGLSVDTVRQWETLPHPAFQMVVFSTMGVAAGVVAVKLFRGDRIAAPVQTAPRPIIVRIVGVPIFVVYGLMALTSHLWSQRIEFGAMALGGLGFVLWPTAFFPRRGEHGA
jgi:hypothetical protein